ncbi:lipopolysaccharide-induced tumor necrosis factor-alpha factor homolog [Ictalurus punctatus]|uniref:Lipopolysaccharide-induced tumor necrosis factor-alpha factor homolog n=1 Tax=Ictalurus punctatus TaxID=7998 RepID=E3TG84_ICTPU|nr:lipopolysaccharide-induced tumor necrosis factor-alpha factor homolog [Ictalurus punctatus]XP_053468618.1 lipopolysaccharide-induced tumor necrosis factor-alpha factor homolog [Ictalurus furcatus]ADO29320.1 lipopolysaccharide-induced tumor necrosis factor-alpha factor-like protein [Ictalurus punctatus]
MASAPPMESSVPVGFAAPPSYDEAMGAGGHYPQGSAVPPVLGQKAAAPYPAQPYSQMYPPLQPVAPVASPPVVSVQTVYVQPAAFGDVPAQTCCPVCSQIVVTRLEHNSGTMAWLVCAGLCIIGCMYGCCLIPFCVDGLKDVTHFCPNCNNAIGSFKRL